MKPHEIGQMFQAQAFKDVGFVGGDRFVADVEFLGNGLMTVSRDQEPSDGFLAIAQSQRFGWGVIDKCADKGLGHMSIAL